MKKNPFGGPSSPMARKGGGFKMAGAPSKDPGMADRGGGLGMAKGGMVGGSRGGASARADGQAKRGKTKGRII